MTVSVVSVSVPVEVVSNRTGNLSKKLITLTEQKERDVQLMINFIARQENVFVYLYHEVLFINYSSCTIIMDTHGSGSKWMIREFS